MRDRQTWWPLAALTSLATAIWALAVAHGYAWQLIWLPGAVAGAAWPRGPKRALGCAARRARR
jgi:hypothetical protein